MRPMVAFVLIMFLAGCDKAPEQRTPSGAVSINPAMVVPARLMLQEHRGIAYLFEYDQADPLGWPADPLEQRVVRIVQDSGIRVAFSDMVPGRRYVALGVKDTDKIAAMRQNILNANLPLTPKLRQTFGLNPSPTTAPTQP
jgi:hypothetical protein